MLPEAFSSLRSRFFTIRSDPKPAIINMLMFFPCIKLVLQITNGFVYSLTLLLNRPACLLLTTLR